MIKSSPRTRSTLSLLTRLTDGRPGLAYNVLLDLTGQFRLYDINEQVDPVCFLDDIVIQMTMYGRSGDATKLYTLCKSMSESECDPSVILLLLMCARNLHQKQPTRSQSIFGLDRVSNAQFQPFTLPRDIPRLFQDLPGIIDIDNRYPKKLLPSKKDRMDCIAESARSAMEIDSEHEYNHRKVAVAKTNSISKASKQLNAFPPPSSFKTANRLLSFLKKEYNRSKYRGNSMKLITEALATTKLDTEPPSRDCDFIYFILSRCVSDPDIDEASETTFVDATSRSPLALTMLQENNVFEEEARRAHSDRTRCVLRRLAVLNERLGPKQAPSDQVSDLISRSALCGAVYRDLVSFADAYAGTAERRTLCAVADFAFRFARVYFQTILSVAADKNIPTSRRAAAVVHAAERFVADGCIIAGALVAVEETDGSAVAVINVLLDESVKREGNETVMQLFYTAVTSYFDYIMDWVFQGSSRRDSRAEFFATVLGMSTAASEHMISEEDLELTLPPFPNILSSSEVLFLLRAGRGRNLLDLFGLNCGILAERPVDVSFGDINLCFDDVKQMFNDLAEKVEGFADVKLTTPRRNIDDRIALDDDTTSPAWKRVKNEDTRQRRVKHKNCKHEDELRYIEDIPQSPDCIRCLAFRIPDMDDDNGDDTSHEIGRNVSLSFSSFSEVEGKIKSVDNETVMPRIRRKARFPLGSMFASELFKPLARIDAVVQKEVLHHFVTELELFEHLRNLRAHVLLGAGDFANELIEQMETARQTSEANERFIHQRTVAAMTFYGTGGPGERVLRDRTYLNQCLRTALNLCSSVGNKLTDLLYLDSDSSRMSLEGKEQERRMSGEQSTLWDSSMEIRYDVAYPLNIVITEEGMRKYSQIFGLFLRILRARKSLRHLFVASRRKRAAKTGLGHAIRGSERTGAVMMDLRLAGRVWQFCWHAEHFVSIFGGFVMEQVLGSCWDDFEAKWETLSSVWEMRDAHMLFLDGCLRRCLLGDRHRSVLRVMTDGFEIVANVEKDVLRLSVANVLDWTLETQNLMDLLASSTASLKRRCAFLTDVLQRLLDGGTLPHLEHFLTRLNFNHYYESADMAC